MRRILSLIAITALVSTAALSQKLPMKYGKIDEAQLKATSFEIDEEAEAIVLADYG